MDTELYGLSCGYWTHDSKKLDAHVIEHIERDPLSSSLFDLFREQAPADVESALEICKYGVTP